MVGRDGLPFTPSRPTRSRAATARCCCRPTRARARPRCSSERFVRSVLEDDVEPGADPGDHVHRQGGGRAARARARALRRARRAATARATSRPPGSRRSTASARGSCARTRCAPGWTRRSRVLEESEARDVRGAAFERALAGFLADERAPTALDVVAAYGVDALQAHDRAAPRPAAQRAADAARAAAGARRAPPTPRALAAALARRRRRAGPPTTRAQRDRRARGAGALRGAAGRPRATPALGGARRRRVQAGQHQGPARATACAAYLRGAGGLRRARGATRWPRAPVALLDELLGRYADAYAEAKRARAALDFDDLELLARDLLRDAPAVARRLRRALRARDGRRVPGHQRRCSSSCWSCWAATRFVVGDELQSIYGFRHADVGIFRAQRAALAERGAAAELATNFRSRPDDPRRRSTTRSAPLHGAAHVPFVAGRADARARPRRASSCC